ncbi:catechol 2,3-dioxygenase [Halopenitus malekzadehii]|uniref:Catechol 2,3-dioxygenase n=1 Tax=Halopenitus malekzadehii TaxID=1267564 RepID=A0A1H6JXM3_9EURY|nr:VOC family protein [Halopenitus malekzadehii]SEH64069.1 catechol 2,3-dioxygenase [Halopenitus malekzadehii]
MTGVQKIEHAHLAVQNLEEATAFFKDAVGLVELCEEDGTIYFGCGLDSNYDLAISDGGTGVRHFAVRVPDVETIEKYEATLEKENVACSRTDGDEPNQEYGVRFSLPTGIDMEFVSVSDRNYRHEVDPAKDRSPIAPIDLDHITLRLLDVQPNAVFLQDVLDFHISDVRETSQGFWRQAFTRFGDYHHDIAMFSGSNRDETLHHLAFTMRDIGHLKTFCDTVAAAGFEVEVGIGRHNAGSNLFIYVRGPGGNRYEFCAEAATLDNSTATAYEDRTSIDQVSAWGGIHAPKSFKSEGS